MIDGMFLVILIGAALVVVSVFTSLISLRVGAPLLLIFLIVGLLAGEDGLGGIVFENAAAGYFVGSMALALILFDSGFGTRFRSFRVAAAPAVTLATLGVLLTMAIVAVPLHLLFAMSWPAAMLLGAIVSSTDAAAVFFLLRTGGITIRERVRATLEIESGSNDPMAIFLTVTLVEMIAAGVDPADVTWEIAGAFALQIGLGLAAGGVGSFVIIRVVNRVQLEPGLYPIVVLGLALVLFGLTGLLGGSGFLAVYVAGLIAGNMRMRAQPTLRRFQDGVTWLSQIVMFLTLGLLATPSEFPAIAVEAIGVALILTFLARPLAVWLCLFPFRYSRQEKLFIAWVGLRGAVSILLGLLPVLGGLPNGQTYFNAAFLIVLTSLFLQGWTIRPLARRLGLIVPPTMGAVQRMELELPGTAHHELVSYRVMPHSPVAQGKRIPRWARPSLVVRDGRSMRIHEAGRPQEGDYVYIFTPPRFIDLLDRLFGDRLDLDADAAFFGEFAVDVGVPIADVGRAYGFAVPQEEERMRVGDYIKGKLGSGIEPGDRLHLGTVDLIVREVGAGQSVTAVGLAVDPTPRAVPRRPTFQNWRDLLRTILRHTRRRETKDATAPRGENTRNIPNMKVPDKSMKR